MCSRFHIQTAARLALAVSLTGTIGDSADARDYSLHMLATVPQVCSLSGARALVSPVDQDGYEAAALLSGMYRISCNVNYALSFSRISHRVRSAPVAGGQAPLLLTFSTLGTDGTVLEASCSVGEDSGSGCDAVSAPDDTRIAKPRAAARLAVKLPQLVGACAVPVVDLDTLGVQRVAWSGDGVLRRLASDTDVGLSEGVRIAISARI